MALQKTTKTEMETWDTVISDLKETPMPFKYKTVFRHNNSTVSLIIDIDPGGGFEGGFEFTSFSAPVPIQFTSFKAPVQQRDEFRFALHDEGIMDKVGKIFGMEDITIGYKEFDKQLIVKTNNAEKVKKVFSVLKVRKVFQSLTDFILQVSKDDQNNGEYILEFMIDRAILNSTELKKLYDAFTGVLDKLGEE